MPALRAASSHRAYLGPAENKQQALLNRAIDPIHRQYLVHGAALDRLLRHAEDHRGGFILGDGVPAGGAHRLDSFDAIVAHAGENDPDRQGARILRGALQGEVGARTVAVDAWTIVERNPARR